MVGVGALGCWRGGGGLMLLLGFEAVAAFGILSWFCVAHVQSSGTGSSLNSLPVCPPSHPSDSASPPPPTPPPVPVPVPVPAPSPPRSPNSSLQSRGKAAGIGLLAVAASLQLLFASLILVKRRHMLRTLQHYERQPHHTETEAAAA